MQDYSIYWWHFLLCKNNKLLPNKWIIWKTCNKYTINIKVQKAVTVTMNPAKKSTYDEALGS